MTGRRSRIVEHRLDTPCSRILPSTTWGRSLLGRPSERDFLTVAAAAPLQEAGITALAMPDSFCTQQANEHAERRDTLMRALKDAGFEARPPQGAYQVMADCSRLGLGRHILRFAFCKKLETLEEAGERLRAIARA